MASQTEQHMTEGEKSQGSQILRKKNPVHLLRIWMCFTQGLLLATEPL